MIRYVHIGDQINEDYDEFAWFNTSSDRFLEFDGKQVFESWEDFVEYYSSDSKMKMDYPLRRFQNLFPSNKLTIEIKPEVISIE